MKWYTLEERIPIDDVDLVVLHETPHLRSPAIGFYMGKGRVMKEGFWYLDENGEAQLFENVRYFMLLPPYPKEFEIDLC